MTCPRCHGFLFREADPYGRTEMSCVNGGWHETVGFVPITEDPTYRHHVREGQVTQARMTSKTIAEQDRAIAARAAQERIRQQRRRLRFVSEAPPWQ